MAGPAGSGVLQEDNHGPVAAAREMGSAGPPQPSGPLKSLGVTTPESWEHETVLCGIFCVALAQAGLWGPAKYPPPSGLGWPKAGMWAEWQVPSVCLPLITAYHLQQPQHPVTLGGRSPEQRGRGPGPTAPHGCRVQAVASVLLTRSLLGFGEGSTTSWGLLVPVSEAQPRWSRRLLAWEEDLVVSGPSLSSAESPGPFCRAG